MKIKMTLGIGFDHCGACYDTVEEVPDEELAGLDDTEIEDYIMENYVRPWAYDYIEMCYDVIEEKERS